MFSSAREDEDSFSLVASYADGLAPLPPRPLFPTLYGGMKGRPGAPSPRLLGDGRDIESVGSRLQPAGCRDGETYLQD
ncbi:hypothetical protein SYN65AY6LI_03435 [Synechococcus sp. 65AY6Li]|nr:hypothetical protein SYN65AY6LI_03435 [Synechococcus sp. 65AY6Li]PIK96435.1 hypothetical protein SYN60AY4M2_06630 [Synechococcus sp. 60AY4M2]PIK99032.1 hypothetical protein SYN63AY4M1_04030 [Synechococcus sp. 63AY4M1]PIL02519.1 hypothetical protein SYN65AY640_10020 [Synechococcus sp. 65AY640]